MAPINSRTTRADTLTCPKTRPTNNPMPKSKGEVIFEQLFPTTFVTTFLSHFIGQKQWREKKKEIE